MTYFLLVLRIIHRIDDFIKQIYTQRFRKIQKLLHLNFLMKSLRIERVKYIYSK